MNMHSYVLVLFFAIGLSSMGFSADEVDPEGAEALNPLFEAKLKNGLQRVQSVVDYRDIVEQMALSEYLGTNVDLEAKCPSKRNALALILHVLIVREVNTELTSKARSVCSQLFADASLESNFPNLVDEADWQTLVNALKDDFMAAHAECEAARQRIHESIFPPAAES